MENKIYLKKTDKEHYHQENSYSPILLSNTLGKIFEIIILQETINILEEKIFSKGKMSMHILKIKCSTGLTTISGANVQCS